ncbi:MAG: hypothetical protein C0467_18000 [Planctomycetaceae bacterium]|nr:hypothetical protein [Planctomycetaceae bacterium]
MRCSKIMISVTTLLGFALIASSSAKAVEPQAAFVVSDGWVSFTLTRDDKPVPDAVVRVYDEQGRMFGEGETGSEGRGEFPLPRGNLFRVEIKIGDRTADMIPLTKVEDRVVPSTVLLSFGLAPCCRFETKATGYGTIRQGTPADATLIPPSIWVKAGGGIILTLLGAAVIVTACRSNRTVPKETE